MTEEMSKIDDRIARTRADVEILMEEYQRQVRLGLIKDIKLDDNAISQKQSKKNTKGNPLCLVYTETDLHNWQ